MGVEGTRGGRSAGLSDGWDVRRKAASRLTPRFQPRCRACVAMAPFPKTGDAGKGPGVRERDAGSSHTPLEDGWPGMQPGGDIMEAAQRGSWVGKARPGWKPAKAPLCVRASYWVWLSSAVKVKSKWFMVMAKEKPSQVYTFWSVSTSHLKTNDLSQEVVLPGLHTEHTPGTVLTYVNQRAQLAKAMLGGKEPQGCRSRPGGVQSVR